MATDNEFFDFLASADDEVKGFFEHLAMLQDTGGIEAVIEFALDPLETGETTAGIISEGAAEALRAQDIPNINDADTFYWQLGETEVAGGVLGAGPEGGNQIMAHTSDGDDGIVVVPPGDGGGQGDDGGGQGGGDDSGSGEGGDGDTGPDIGFGGQGPGGGDDFDPNPDAGAFQPGAWFTDPDPEVVSEPGIPTMSETDLTYARNLLEAELRMAGFDTNAIGRLLEDWIIPRLKGTYVDAETGTVMLPPDEAADLLPELYEQHEFKVRFPGYHPRIDGGYNAIDIQDYLSYEDRFHELMTQYGLDSIIAEGGRSTKEYIGNLISGNVSLQQLDTRITRGVAAVLDAPEEVLQQFEQWYGSEGENALLASYLDPTAELTDLATKAGAAMAGGLAKRSLDEQGISKQMAEDIADLDYSNQQLQEAYTALAGQASLFAERAGEEDFKITDEGVSAALQLDSDVMDRVNRRRRERAADFAGGGGAMVSGTTTGFGSANA